jgi:tetratricopeptide (TPR) repeat protein
MMRGELDWIVMKALEKDRARRYETANGLAADVLHYLADEAVLACPPSSGYRFRKFVRRNKGPVLATGVILLCLIGGIIGTTFGLVEAKRQERFAVAEAVEKENARVAEAQQRRQAEDQRDRALKAEAQAEANFRQARLAVDDMYTQVAEKWLAQQPRLEPLQREFLQKALRFYEESSKRTSADPGVRFDTAQAHRRVAEIQYGLGPRAQAEPACGRAIDLLEKLVEEFPTVPEYRQELADTLHKMGTALASAGRNPEREKVHRRALALQEKLVADFPAVPEYRRELGRGYWFLGRLLSSIRQRAEQENAYRSAMIIQNGLVAEFPAVPEYRQQLAASYFGFGEALRYQGRPQEYRQATQEAAAILEKLVAENPTHPGYRSDLAGAYFWLADLLPSQEAEQFIDKALILQEQLASDFPGHTDYRYDLFRSLITQGYILLRAERTTEAEQSYRRAVQIGEKLVAESPTVHYYRSRLASGYRGLADLLGHTGKFSEAEALYERSISLYERLLVEVPDVADAREQVVHSYLGLARVLVSTGRQQEAEKAYGTILELNGKSAAAHNNLARLLATAADAKFRDGKRAVELAKQAVEIEPQQGMWWNTLGAAQYRAGDWKAAIEALSKSMELRKGGDSFDWFFLAMTHWQLGQKEEARKWYEKAIAWMDKNLADNEELRRFRAEAEDLMAVEAKLSPENQELKSPETRQ